ncbi:hypothetical protein ABIC09_004885 [Bradyrhizobium sp. S3.12.5]|uniref:hypothetical protein n=1 Tax=Bradyrhizobium sp. S3.12.5 TaxID=3156386 RepID=UPI00339094C3
MFYRFAALSFLVIGLSGCAIHPLPENVTGVDTPDIVRQIRCEAREAVIAEVKRWLAKKPDPISQRLLAKYEAEPESISEFNPNVFPPAYSAERIIVKLFYGAGVAYTFDLKMAEFNDINPTSVNLLRPSPPQPKFTLGLGAGALLDRSNERKFTATDTFGSLLKLNAAERQGRRYCTGFIVTENYVYPIAGKIGVAKVIHDFINLTLFESLSGDKGAPPAMTDDLTFTTTVSASVNPAVLFTPLGTALQVSDAALTASFKRSDVHEVVVGVAIDKSDAPDLAPVRSYLFSQRRFANGLTPTRPATVSGGLFIGNRVIGGGSASERLAVIANDQAKSQQVTIVPSP